MFPYHHLPVSLNKKERKGDYIFNMPYEMGFTESKLLETRKCGVVIKFFFESRSKKQGTKKFIENTVWLYVQGTIQNSSHMHLCTSVC